MEITLTIPDELAASLADGTGDPARLAMEALAVEGYRQRRLSAFEVGRMLGHNSRWETEDFLAAHGTWPGLTVEDLTEELAGIDHCGSGTGKE